VSTITIALSADGDGDDIAYGIGIAHSVTGTPQRAAEQLRLYM
jgi:hypothetical protein